MMRTTFWMGCVGFVLLAGCASGARDPGTDTPSRARGGGGDLSEGYQALRLKNFDEAMRHADAALARASGGTARAEALYLQGRTFEERVTVGEHSEADAAAALDSARRAYVHALREGPNPRLESFIRTSLGNVAYFQHDYETALSQWRLAYPMLEQADVRAWVLYRTGLTLQRLGRFEEADRAFARVQRDHPGTVPAQQAHEREGTRSFSVQLAVYSSPASADSAIASLQGQGVTPQRSVDAMGRQVIRLGPVSTYDEALGLKQRFAEIFPDAFIAP